MIGYLDHSTALHLLQRLGYMRLYKAVYFSRLLLTKGVL